MTTDSFASRMLAEPDKAPARAEAEQSVGARDAEWLHLALQSLARQEPSENASAQVAQAIVADLEALRTRKKAVPAWVAAAALVLASAVASVIVGRSESLGLAQGLHCLTEVALAGAMPYMAIAIGLRLLRAHQFGPWLAPVAAGGALFAQFALHFGCPNAHGLAHLVAFHTGGVVIAAVLGTSSGVRMLRAVGA
jgi:hypothetical protein